MGLVVIGEVEGIVWFVVIDFVVVEGFVVEVVVVVVVDGGE